MPRHPWPDPSGRAAAAETGVLTGAADPAPEGPPSADEDSDRRHEGDRRRCLVTRAVLPREALVRFVLDPDNAVVADVDERLPGRGAWVTATRAVVAEAARKRLFGRAFRRSVGVPTDLADRVALALSARLRDGLGLARRAGLVIAGYDQVHAALRAGGGHGGVLLGAADASPQGRARLRALAGRPGTDAQAARLVSDILGSAELAAPLGREHVVHVLVSASPLADRLAVDLGRLAGFIGGQDVPDRPVPGSRNPDAREGTPGPALA